MNGRKRVEDAIETLAKRENIPGFKLNSNGCVGLRLINQEELKFEFNPQYSALLIYIKIQSLPVTDREKAQLFEQLLMLNFTALENRIAISPTVNEVYLMQRLSADKVTADLLDDAIDVLLAHRTHIMDEIKKVAEQGNHLAVDKGSYNSSLAYSNHMRDKFYV